MASNSLPQSDFQFANHGSICILSALTPAAKQWADDGIIPLTEVTP